MPNGADVIPAMPGAAAWHGAQRLETMPNAASVLAAGKSPGVLPGAAPGTVRYAAAASSRKAGINGHRREPGRWRILK